MSYARPRRRVAHPGAVTLVVIAVAAIGTACGETGRAAVSFPFHAGGTGVTGFDDDGWHVTITEARVAFGPAYFCASSAADLDLCETAVAELRDSVTVDALVPAAEPLGEIDAVTGTVRSAMWDHGLTFLLAAERPRPTAGAVGGRSATFRGTAERGAERFDWSAAVEIVASVSGTSAVRAVRTEHAIESENDALVVRFDPAAILARVDWASVASSAEMGVARIEPGSVAHNAIVIAMTSSALPTLEWGAPEP